MAEGEEATCMYMIYEGSIGIYMYGQKINHRTAGEPLGESALDNDSLRTASAIAESEVFLLRLKRTDYEDIILTIKKNEKKQYMVFLMSMDIFQYWNEVKIMMLSNLLIVSSYAKGEIIYEPDEFSHSFYMIKEGAVEIQTEVKILEENKWPVSPREWNVRKITKKIYHPIQSLKEKDCFGQIEILDRTCRQTRAIAVKNCVCLVINRHEFEEYFNPKDREILKNNFKIPSKEQIERSIRKAHNNVLEKEKILLDVVLQNKQGHHGENKKTEKWKKFVQERMVTQRQKMKQTVVKHTMENIKYSKS